MWFSSGQPKTHIEEANRHLVALTEKIKELEEKLQSKEEELKKKEDDFAIIMQEVHTKRQLENKSLDELIYQQNLKLKRLERDLVNRDSELSVLRKRCRMFDEVLRYKATLAKLTITMEQAEQYANLTSHARDYLPNNNYKDSLDLINTEPAPLMLPDSEFEPQGKEEELIDEVSKSFVHSQTSNKQPLAQVAANGYH